MERQKFTLFQQFFLDLLHFSNTICPYSLHFANDDTSVTAVGNTERCDEVSRSPLSNHAATSPAIHDDQLWAVGIHTSLKFGKLPFPAYYLIVYHIEVDFIINCYLRANIRHFS